MTDREIAFSRMQQLPVEDLHRASMTSDEMLLLGRAFGAVGREVTEHTIAVDKLEDYDWNRLRRSLGQLVLTCQLLSKGMRPDEFYSRVTIERQRQEELLKAGKFKWSCASHERGGGTDFVTNSDRLAVVAEEVGEVFECETYEEQKKEVVQVAACAVAWLEAIGIE